MPNKEHWTEWDNEEILAEVEKVKRQGFGHILIEVWENKVREVVPSIRMRKTGPRPAAI